MKKIAWERSLVRESFTWEIKLKITKERKINQSPESKNF